MAIRAPLTNSVAALLRGPKLTPTVSRGPMNPITKAKMDNGVPGMKKGGKVKAGRKK